MNERIVEVSLDEFMFSFEVDQPDEMNEDDFYRMVVDYVFSHINVEVIQVNKTDWIGVIALFILCLLSVILLSTGRLDESVTRGEFIIGTLLSLDVLLRQSDRYFKKQEN